ncbi:uncharacterized protein LOC119838237 [Zerene cesonia]|uniref:uncharacterized protein LOC119838237 n=1 Tax=Zerene cesonia TaxID=33412 RepID=UPI0018E563A8|nr:uncharacterized protein LOC119838237 [Zerene cesonia]
MEENFKKLQKDKQNTVDNLIKWLKDCKIIDGKNVTEDKARKLFDDVADAKNVEFKKFQDAVTKLAAGQQKNVDAFMKSLADEAPKVLEAVAAAASALKEALIKK